MATGAELNYNINASALNMANQIFGSGVSVVSASYSGPSLSSATFSNGQLTGGATGSTYGVILSTGDVRNFTQSNGDPNRSAGTSTDTSGSTNNSSQFNTLAGTNTFDAVWLDVNFIPTGNVMTMRFVFSSEEYPEYVDSSFNDVMGVWINGQNVPITVGNGSASINNINPLTQPNLFVDNTQDAFNTEMDGFTVTLSLTIPVNPGVQNTIRIGIADAGDAQYDSNLIILGDSVQTVLVPRDDLVQMYATGEATLNVLGNDRFTGSGTLTITQINGVNVTAGQTITLPSGQQIRLNADGTITIIGDGDLGNSVFTYTVSGGGQTATGLVKVDAIPCFVAGTLILTPEGERAVESLRPGDLVLTRDDGPQPLRWIGTRRVEASGLLAPIDICPGTFGSHGRLLVSPQHRILIRDSLAELLFGEAEVLVAAKDLVNGTSVRRREGGTVDYIHILFDRHQLVTASGLATESFLPGSQTSRMFSPETLAEIGAALPGVDPATGEGYGPAARRLLKAYEAQMLRKPGAKAA